MRNHKKEIIKLTAAEVLSALFDIPLGIVGASSIYRKSYHQHLDERLFERETYSARIQYLKRKGYILDYVEGKERFAELTPEGYAKLQEINFKSLLSRRPAKWDGKWRVAIFDVAEKSRRNRDRFRRRLLEVGFIRVQESIYVYPFECTGEVMALSKNYGIADAVLVMISEIMQGEAEIIDQFIERKILTKADVDAKESAGQTQVRSIIKKPARW